MKRFVFLVPTALCLILIGALTNFLPAIEPNITSSQYVIESWTVDQGLPQNTVSCVLRSSDGYLWVGTGNGAARFDGAEFTVFNMFNTPEFKGQDIRGILEDKDKNLWFFSAFSIIRFKDGLFEDFSWMEEIKKGRYLPFKNEEGCFFVLVESGVLHYKDGRFIHLESEEGMACGQVNSYHRDSRGLLWVATDNGVKRFRQNRFEPVVETEGLAVQWVYNDRRGNLWMRTPRGLKRLWNGTIESFDFAQELSPYITFFRIEEDGHENCWIYASNGLFRSQKNKYLFVREKAVPDNASIHDIRVDQKGNVWLGTTNGLYRYYADQFFLLKKRHGLSDDYINVIFEDNQENLWLGTKRGLTVLKNPRVVTYSSEEVPGCEYPRSLYQDRQGRIWIMGDFIGIVRYDRGIFERIVENLPGGKNFSAGGFCEDAQGRLWLGRILTRFKDGEFVPYKNRHGEDIDKCRVIWDDGTGCLWVGGTSEGIIQIRNGETSIFSTEDGLSHNLVFEITEARDGTVWIGTKTGVTLYKDGIFRSIQKEGGLSEKAVMDIFQDEEGTIWIGTCGGLYRYHDDSFFCYTSAHGLPDDVILGILEDEKGNLWMSSNRGIFFVKKSELHDLADGRIRSLLPVSFDKNDGMKVVECNGGMQPSCIKAHDGRLWFPTMKGVVVVDPPI